ncbi:cell division protein FtsZ [candidate division MSBL1 archaeon SCGC-AAA259I09]|uniref:Cell division protein FtsZ n=2 Tax=candidate division MSBL1 TaxID=215777 RepID=A0A133UTC5_9EURY|nr:cell division protein FtsZ [candidate division MSBL1 archaeon SCGC-AAA259I09]KXA98796.1 cell division protein FtsZ [candidate division MSBL1 archaeon SCGC-AAA259J03]
MEPTEKNSDAVDEELEQALREARARIVSIGCGGAGGNTISRMMEVGIQGAETIAINTDAQDLLYATADRKLLIGREATGGLGAGNDPSKGEEAARENESDIKELLHGSDLVFITCGLGGGTGTGSAPVVAEIAKRLSALTVVVVTLPFSVEGKRRSRNAEVGLKKLQQVSDTVIVIPNDKLLEVAPDLPIPAAFKVADQLLMDSIKGITELITKPGLINLDFADVSTVLEGNGVAMIGIGESDTESRAADAANEALNSPLLDVDVTGASGALVNVTGSPDMSLDEAESIVGRVSEALDPEAQVSWGAQVSDDLKKAVKVMVILSGVHSPYVLGPDEEPTGDRIGRGEEEVELGLESLE